MHNRVYLIHVDTLQNAVKRMTEEIAFALEAQGFETTLFDPFVSTDDYFADLAAGAVAGLVSLNLYGFNTRELVAATNQAGAPVFFFSTDHPYLSPDKQAELLGNFTRIRISMTGESELAAALRLYGPAAAAFSVLRQGTSVHAEAPWSKRDIPNLTVGNSPLANHVEGQQDPETFRRLWLPSYGEELTSRLNRMVEIHDADPRLPLLEVLDEALAGEPLAEPPSRDHQSFCLCVFDLYQRTRIRAEGLRRLAEAPGLICGLGWDFLKGPRTRAHFLGSFPSQKVLDLASRARYLYNLVPQYYSCSERVLEAATLGTPVVTTPSAFFDREFGATLKTIASADALSEHLAHPEPEDVVRERVARARAIAVERHTWTERTRHIAEFFRDAWKSAA